MNKRASVRNYSGSPQPTWAVLLLATSLCAVHCVQGDDAVPLGQNVHSPRVQLQSQGIDARLNQFTLSKVERHQVEALIVDAQIATLNLSRAGEAKIVGGTPASYPWAAALLLADSNGNKIQFCGGTLIAPDKILTAAHCNVYPIGFVQAMVGQSDIAAASSVSVSIKSFVPHPDYKEADSGNDVAVITLAKPIQGATPVKLSTVSPAETVPSLLKIVGWGATHEGGVTSRVLLEAPVPLVPLDTCKKPYPQVQQTMLCAGYQGGGVDTCQGDSGGPALLLGSDGEMSQLGVTSFGNGCARAGYYGVYTRVPSFLAWIKSQ